MCLSIDRILYSLISFWPYFLKFYHNICGRSDNICETAYDLIKISKIFQIGGYYILYHSPQPHESFKEYRLARYRYKAISFQNILGLNLFVVGLFLKLTTKRFITSILYLPTIIPHQYIGSILTTYGFIIILATDDNVLNGWLGLGHVQMLHYLFMGIIDNSNSNYQPLDRHR